MTQQKWDKISFSACFHHVFINFETETEQRAASETSYGEKEAAKILFAEFHEEMEELLKKIRSLENKIDTIEWKIDPRSDPRFWNESNDDLPKTDNKDTETEAAKERKGVQYYYNKIQDNSFFVWRVRYCSRYFPE